jgi:hypothetical protein
MVSTFKGLVHTHQAEAAILEQKPLSFPRWVGRFTAELGAADELHTSLATC